MNAATPWEQLQMAGLFARQVAAPRTVLWGIDATWCEADATDEAKRLTPRPFPPWLYDGIRWRDWAELMNLTTLEIAGRLLAHRLGLMPERIRGDGYEVFTPPEELYDAARARWHLYGGAEPPPDSGRWSPPRRSRPKPEPDGASRPWPGSTTRWHASRPARGCCSYCRRPIMRPSPAQGSVADQREAACKEAVAALAKRRGAALIDYARRHRSRCATTTTGTRCISACRSRGGWRGRSPRWRRAGRSNPTGPHA